MSLYYDVTVIHYCSPGGPKIKGTDSGILKRYKLRLFIKNMELQVLVGFSVVPKNY